MSLRINSETFAEFKEKHELAVLSNVEAFEFCGELITLTYSQYVVEYWEAMQRMGLDIDFLEQFVRMHNALSCIKQTVESELTMVVCEVLGKKRIVLATHSPQGMVPLFMAIDDEMYADILKNKL